MPRARDFLARFRPVGTPWCAAASAGVPADRVAEAGAELEPLFAMLADTEAEIDRVRASADQRIAEGHRLSAERAADVLAQSEAARRRGAGGCVGQGPSRCRSRGRAGTGGRRGTGGPDPAG